MLVESITIDQGLALFGGSLISDMCELESGKNPPSSSSPGVSYSYR